MKREKKYPSEAADRFQIRLPDGLRDELKALAERNGRSMNAEIVARLQESLKSPYPELSGYGFEALVRRLGGAVTAMENLFIATKEISFPGSQPTAEQIQAIRDAPESRKREIIETIALERDIDKAVAIAKSGPKKVRKDDK